MAVNIIPSPQLSTSNQSPSTTTDDGGKLIPTSPPPAPVVSPPVVPFSGATKLDNYAIAAAVDAAAVAPSKLGDDWNKASMASNSDSNMAATPVSTSALAATPTGITLLLSVNDGGLESDAQEAASEDAASTSTGADPPSESVQCSSSTSLAVGLKVLEDPALQQWLNPEEDDDPPEFKRRSV